MQRAACSPARIRTTSGIIWRSSRMSTEIVSADGPAAIDGLPAERRGWAAAAIFTAVAMASLDTAIANIALPAIAADLHVGPADVIWVVNVYQIALVATLLPLAALGEIVGHRRIYLGGLLLFSLGALACAEAWSLPSLLIARVLQGLGASGIMSVNTALVRFIFPGHLQGRGFGHNAMVVATAFTLGPTIASGILAIGPWSWLFGINIPFGLVAILIGLKTFPRTPRATHAFDFPGPRLAAGCLGDSYAVGLLGGVGLALLGLGMALLAMLPANPGIVDIVWRMAICGCGFGFFQAPNIKALMSSAPADRSGSASGIVATARLTRQTTGAARAALCFGLAGREGATVALVLGAAFAAVGCVMSSLRLIAKAQ